MASTSTQPTFVSRLFAYPSPLTVAAQGLLILLLTSWLSWIVFFIAIIITVVQFVKQIFVAIRGVDISPPCAVFITGASTGIGAALAAKYASEGTKTIYITGRSSLEETVKKCKAMAKDVAALTIVPIKVDVNDVEQMKIELIKADKSTPLDIIIANAGISPEQQKDKSQEEIFRNTYGTNITGVVNTIFPLYDTFVQRKSGHIVLISSIASFGNIAHPAYSSSKACITTMGQGLRRDLHDKGVKVSVICPGFVESNMTRERHEARKGGLPFYQSQETAVDIMYRGIQQNIDVIVFPFALHLLAYPVLRSLPYFIQDYVALTLAKLAYRAPDNTIEDKSIGSKPVEIAAAVEKKID